MSLRFFSEVTGSNPHQDWKNSMLSLLSLLSFFSYMRVTRVYTKENKKRIEKGDVTRTT